MNHHSSEHLVSMQVEGKSYFLLYSQLKLTKNSSSPLGPWQATGWLLTVDSCLILYQNSLLLPTKNTSDIKFVRIENTRAAGTMWERLQFTGRGEANILD